VHPWPPQRHNSYHPLGTGVNIKSRSGWMGGWVDGWMGGWVDGWMGGGRPTCLPRVLILDVRSFQRSQPKIGSCNQGCLVFLFSRIKWAKAHKPCFHVGYQADSIVQTVTLTEVEQIPKQESPKPRGLGHFWKIVPLRVDTAYPGILWIGSRPLLALSWYLFSWKFLYPPDLLVWKYL
jgi:hypothetical protein